MTTSRLLGPQARPRPCVVNLMIHVAVVAACSFDRKAGRTECDAAGTTMERYVGREAHGFREWAQWIWGASTRCARVDLAGLLPCRRRLSLLRQRLLRVRRHVSGRCVMLVRHRGEVSRLHLYTRRRSKLVGHLGILGGGENALEELLPGSDRGHGRDIDRHHLAVVRDRRRDGHATHRACKGRERRCRVLPRMCAARSG